MIQRVHEMFQLAESLHFIQKDVSVRTAKIITFVLQFTNARAFLNSSVRQALASVMSQDEIEAELKRYREAGFDV